MKKFSILAAFLFAVMMSLWALAADWIHIVTEDETKVFVDKSSIKRGVQSERYNIVRADGFSALVKLEFDFKDGTFTMINLVGFFEENGAKKYCMLEGFNEDGSLIPAAQQPDKAEVANADGTDGTVWPKVYDYVQKNLP